MSNKQVDQNENIKENGFIDISKHVDDWRVERESQVKAIEWILRHHFASEDDNDRGRTPRIFIPDLKLLGYKNTTNAIKTLQQKGAIKVSSDAIELNTEEVYCSHCGWKVFNWDRLDHLTRVHHWSEQTFKHNIWGAEFTSKALPEKKDHDYEQITPLENGEFKIRCKDCGYERTIWIDMLGRKECQPADRSIFVDNPDDETNIAVKVGLNSTPRIFATQQEYRQFVAEHLTEQYN